MPPPSYGGGAPEGGGGGRPHRRSPKNSDLKFSEISTAAFPLPTLPRMTLGDSHISQSPSFGDAVEVVEAMLEGDGPWWFGGGISIPSAQSGDDPSGPSEGFLGMRVALLFGSWRVLIGFDGVQSGDFVVVEGDRGGRGALSVTGLAELHDPPPPTDSAGPEPHPAPSR